jgi:hypothetical protein
LPLLAWHHADESNVRRDSFPEILPLGIAPAEQYRYEADDSKILLGNEIQGLVMGDNHTSRATTIRIPDQRQ